jgi:hypothetical protein
MGLSPVQRTNDGKCNREYLKLSCSSRRDICNCYGTMGCMSLQIGVDVPAVLISASVSPILQTTTSRKFTCHWRCHVRLRNFNLLFRLRQLFLHSESTNQSSISASNNSAYVDKFSQSANDVPDDQLMSCYANIQSFCFRRMAREMDRLTSKQIWKTACAFIELKECTVDLIMYN